MLGDVPVVLSRCLLLYLELKSREVGEAEAGCNRGLIGIGRPISHAS